MANITQYLKDTRGELRHVAWPTQSQTIIYTLIIAGISIFIALYLGLFDFFFTTGLGKAINVLPSTNPVSVTQPSTNSQPSQNATAGKAGQATTPIPTPTFNTNLGGTPTPKK